MKLYKGTQEVLFLSGTTDLEILKKEATGFISEQRQWCKGNLEILVNVKEITSEDAIPKNWEPSNYLWGTNDDITALEFFQNQKEEYKEFLEIKEKYLALKDKFEK